MKRKLLTFMGLMVTAALLGCSDQPTNSPSHENEEPVLTEEIAQVEVYDLSLKDFNTIFPNWVFLEQHDLIIDGTHYVALALENTVNEYEKRFKIAIASYEKETEEWVVNWEYQNFDDGYYPYISFRSMLSVNPPNENKALLVVDHSWEGSTGHGDVYAFSISNKGVGTLEWQDICNYIELQDDQIVVSEQGKKGKKVLTIRDGAFSVQEIPRSESAPNHAIDALFTIDANNRIIAVNEREISLKVGDTLAFVPEGEIVKKAFDSPSDKQDITIYIGDVAGGGVMLAGAHTLYQGNSIDFTEPGTYEVIIEYSLEQNGDYIYNGYPFEERDYQPLTFIVNVN